LLPEEKIWAKIGTAQILRHRCLAWEFDRNCLVCDEVCPFDAISLKKVEGLATQVPFVDETRCSGCGFCEFHCPVQDQSAIEVFPMAAFRITTGSYREHGLQQGFSLKLKQLRRKIVEPAPEPQKSGLPPGFTS
jgi:MinD superfamily P-loop ATPase